jgi:hypothetical protein
MHGACGRKQWKLGRVSDVRKSSAPDNFVVTNVKLEAFTWRHFDQAESEPHLTLPHLLHQGFSFKFLLHHCIPTHILNFTMSTHGYAEGTTERLNEQLEKTLSSCPVNDEPGQKRTQSDNGDEGIDGTGVTWPSRTQQAQKDHNKAEQQKAAADQAQPGGNHKSSEENDDEGVDGSGLTWKNSP